MIGKIIKTSRPLFWIAHIIFFGFGAIATNNYIPPFSFAFLFPVILLTLPFSLFVYAINDYYDMISDNNNPRKGGVFGAKHTNEYHKKLPLFAGIGWLISAVGFSIFGLQILVIFLVLSGILYFYSALPIRFKAIPVLDFVTGAYLYALGILLLGFLIFKGNPKLLFDTISIPFYFASIVAVINHIFFAVIDEVPDKKQKITTSAVFFGAHNMLLFCLGLIAISFIVALQNYLFFLQLLACLIICVLLWSQKYRKNMWLQKFAGEYLMYVGFFVVLYTLFIDQNFIR